MGIQDRDWYREEMRKRARSESANRGRSWPSALSGVRRPYRWALLVVLLACVVGVARDMKDRGIPLSWHGLKWWLSLWFGS